jgi:hypothetical protein
MKEANSNQQPIEKSGLARLRDLFQQALPKALSITGNRAQRGAKKGIVKHYGSKPVAAPDKNATHYLSIFTLPVIKPIGKARKVSTKGNFCLSQHERVVAARAARMGISVNEYKIRFGAKG